MLKEDLGKWDYLLNGYLILFKKRTCFTFSVLKILLFMYTYLLTYQLFILSNKNMFLFEYGIKPLNIYYKWTAKKYF